MKKFLNIFKAALKKITNAFALVNICVVYFIFITPFGIFVRIFKDYLKTKPQQTHWSQREEITDIGSFLKKQ